MLLKKSGSGAGGAGAAGGHAPRQRCKGRSAHQRPQHRCEQADAHGPQQNGDIWQMRTHRLRRMLRKVAAAPEAPAARPAAASSAVLRSNLKIARCNSLATQAPVTVLPVTVLTPYTFRLTR